MATAMTVPQIAPRPVAAATWSQSSAPHRFMPASDSRPALKSLRQSQAPSRSRRDRPCDGCRRRKSKCVLQEARKCVLCEFHKQECTFVENAQPRKRRLDDGGGGGGGVESPPRKSPATSRTSTAQSSPRVRKQTLGSAPPLPSPAAAQPPATSQPQAPAAAPMSSAHLHRSPFLVDESLSLQRHVHCKYLGQTTAYDASLLGLGILPDDCPTASQFGNLRQVADHEYFSTHADAEVPVPDDEARALAEIESIVGGHGPALIDIYFRNVHPSYPIVQKNTFMDRHRNGDRQFNPPLLAGMYLLALSWWDLDSTLSQHPKPPEDRLEYIANTSLAVAMRRPKMSAVQAGLLLLQRSKASSWTLTVQLVALGQDIGLHLDCSEWSIPLWERRLRKRLAWALYMQDKWSALVHGRPSHINAADWAVPTPVDDDFDDTVIPTQAAPPPDPDASKGRILYMQTVALTLILSDVINTFYSQTAQAEARRTGAYATQLILNRAKPVQLALKSWFANLPPECKLDTSLTPPPSPHPTTEPSDLDYTTPLPSTASLHLAYFATEISIHRRIIQTLPSPASLPQAAESNPHLPTLLPIIRSAAKTRLISALEFAARLRPHHLHAFWLFPSAANCALIGSFGAALAATAPGWEERGFYEGRLRELRWSLGVGSRRAPWMAGAVEWVGGVVGGLEGGRGEGG